MGSVCAYLKELDITGRKKNLAKYLKLCATAEPILLTISSSYMVESGYRNIQYLLSKGRSTLNTERSVLLL